ncbi:hypothetical protein [Streptomyces sp. DSM 118878]
MREKPDYGKESQDQEEPKEKRRLDLSVPQVAGSAIAAVVAAKLASNLGVYGTILGAGVVSGVATCGGTIFQHFFRRTGEQIRVVAVQAKPKAQQVPGARASSVPDTFKPPETSKISGTSGTSGTSAAAGTSATPVTFQTATRAGTTAAGPVTTTWGRPRTAEAEAEAEADETTVLPSLAAADDATRVLRADALPGAPETAVLQTAVPETVAMPPLPAGEVAEEFTEGTTHRARIRSWKRPLIAAAVVFGVSMGGITTYELVAGKDFSGGDGTTISNLTGNRHTSPKEPSTPADEPTGQPSDNGTSGTDDEGTRKDDGGAMQDPEGTGGRTPGTGDGTDSGSGSGSGSKDADENSGGDTDKDTGSGSGNDDSRTDPTPTTPPTPTPSSGTGTGTGDGTDTDGGAQQGETPSP